MGPPVQHVARFQACETGGVGAERNTYVIRTLCVTSNSFFYVRDEGLTRQLGNSAAADFSVLAVVLFDFLGGLSYARRKLGDSSRIQNAHRMEAEMC